MDVDLESFCLSLGFGTTLLKIQSK